MPFLSCSPLIEERVEQYDTRLDRINKLLEKYALLNTLYGRLAQQAPARAQMSNRPRYTQPTGPPAQGMPPGGPPPGTCSHDGCRLLRIV